MPLSCWVWAPEVPPGPLAGFSETWPGNLHPGKFQVPITAGWTGVQRC